MKNNISLNSKIFKIAFPSIAGFLGIIIFESVDIYWIGKIGTKAQAAIGAASFIHWAVMALMNFTTTGCMTLVGQFYGAKKVDEKMEVVKESFWVSLLFSFLIMGFLLIFTKDLFLLMGLDKETLRFALDYFYVLTLGLPVFYLFQLQAQIFNGHGDTKKSNYVMIFIIILNIIIDPLLIFGYAGFPKMGIAGAALATVLSEVIGVSLRYYILRKEKYIPRFMNMFSFGHKHIKSIIKIGTPSALTSFVWCLIYPMLTTLITSHGMIPLAALNIGHRIEGFPYFFSVGFSIAIGALVAQSYGAKKVDEIRQIVNRGIVLITMVLSVFAFSFIVFPEFLAGLLTDDPKVIFHAAKYLRIIGYFEIFLGWEIVLEGAFNGLGNGKPFMLLRIPVMLSRYPIAYLFMNYFNMGLDGVWWAVSLSTLVSGVSLLIVFKYNKKNQELIGI